MAGVPDSLSSSPFLRLVSLVVLCAGNIMEALSMPEDCVCIQFREFSHLAMPSPYLMKWIVFVCRVGIMIRG